MRADRLLMVLSLLQKHGQIASKELSKQLEVSERTIHRDMEALSIAGIPVYAERGARGGWTLSEGYRNQMTGMNTDEIRSLLLLHSSSVVRDLGLHEQVQSAFRRWCRLAFNATFGCSPIADRAASCLGATEITHYI